MAACGCCAFAFRDLLKDEFLRLYIRIMRIKYLLSFVGAAFVLFAVSQNIHASVVTIGLDGELVMNVLSYESQRESITVTELMGGQIPIGDRISLKNDGGKSRLLVTVGGNSYEADVTDFEGEVIEIEERIIPNTVKVFVEKGEFLIQQRGYTARTRFPITIEAATKEFSVKTSSGVSYLSILPYEAIDNLMRAGILSKLHDNSQIKLSEDPQGGMKYVASGIKSFKLFTFIEFEAEVVVSVSASTGEVLSVEQPLWLSVFGHFLS